MCPIILDIWQDFEYALGSQYARILHMPQYSYNNIIIIVTNVIILEFLSARFVHPGTLQLNTFFNTTWDMRTTKATMTSETSKYLNEQLGVFLNKKQQKP